MNCRISVLGVCTLLLILCFFLIGCGGGGGGGTSLTVTDAHVIVPGGFNFEGGNVTIRADITGGTPSDVFATITLPDDTQDTVEMTLLTGNTYRGLYFAPENLDMDGEADRYTIVVTATESVGDSVSSDSFFFDVPALDIPEPPE